MTVGYHRMGEDELVQKTLLKVKIDCKVNDAAGSLEKVYLADVSPIVSKMTLRY